MQTPLFFALLRRVLPLVMAVLGAVSAWGGDAPPQAGVVPPGTFKGHKPAAVSPPTDEAAQGQVTPLRMMVWLYASSNNEKYLQRMGVDAKAVVFTWERFLRKYRLPFKTLQSADKLDAAVPGVLVLPSQVMLSAAEKRAIAAFRDRGGSVLTTWYAGVRDDAGDWVGFDFMHSVLDTAVLRDTEATPDANFLMPYGAAPMAHDLPAGERVWTDRVAGQYPVLLRGQHTAAWLMDWSRMDVAGSGPVAVYGESRRGAGALSRQVALGYNERIWAATEARQMEAIAYDALAWLLRQPAVRLGLWPAPFSTAMTFMMDAPEVMDELDIQFAQRVERLGTRMTVFATGPIWAPSAQAVQTLIAAGHAMGSQGDKFESFKGQSAAVQAQRLQEAQSLVAAAGVQLPPGALFFRPPMDAMDDNTLGVLLAAGYDAAMVFNDRVDHRLPSWAELGAHRMALLPFTLPGPEDLIAEGDPQEGAETFLQLLNLSAESASLSVVKFPNQTLIPPEQLDLLFTRFAAEKPRAWMATVPQVVAWWQARSGAQLEPTPTPTGVDVRVTAPDRLPAGLTPALWLDLPGPQARLELVRLADGVKTPFQRVGRFQAMVPLSGLKPGDNRFRVQTIN